MLYARKARTRKTQQTKAALPEPRQATITAIVEPQIVKDEFGGYPRRTTGYVQATDETGMVHNFINGSWNRVHNPVKVGDRGTVEFISSGSMALWYWRPTATRPSRAR